MSVPLLRLYINNPTRNGYDGQEASENSYDYPVTTIVNTREANHTLVKAALRCDAGWKTTGVTQISFTGATAARWEIADDDQYADAEQAELATYSDVLNLSSSIGDKNHIIWLKVSATATESAQVDTSVQINVYGRLVPAS